MSTQHRPTSWIATCIASGEVFELFNKENADKAKASPYLKVETAGEHLARINQEIKSGSTKYNS